MIVRALYTVKQKLNSDCSTGQLVTGGMLLHYEELKRPDGALRLDRAGGASEKGGFPARSRRRGHGRR